MERIEDLRELVDTMCTTLKPLGALPDVNIDVENAVRVELSTFLMYLSASDGKIQFEEADFITKVCCINLLPKNIAELIRENNIYSTEFEERVPATFNLIVSLEKELIENGINIEAATIMLDCYKIIGEALIHVDGEPTQSELDDYNTYINMLETYIKTSLEGVGDVTTGFVKNTGKNTANNTDSSPKSNSVAAPKKN